MGKTVTQLSALFNLSDGTISRHLKLCGQETLWNGCGSSIRAKFDENFFSVIDSHAKAYTLGFMFADGNIASKSNQMTIAIHKKDVEVLEFISKKMSFNGNFCFCKDTVKLQVSSKIIKADLINLGCIPRKTHVLQFPDKVPSQYLNSFVLGYFDGDGCISIDGKQIVIAGTENFCKALISIANSLDVKKSYRTVASNNKTNIFTIGSPVNTIKFLDWCYKDLVVLDRKFQRYKKLKNKMHNLV